MTEHLPIQRWQKIFTRYPASEIVPSENREYVTYAYHLAALRACEQRIRNQDIATHHADLKEAKALLASRDEAWFAGVEAAREAVAALDAYYAIEECEGNPLEKGDPEDPDPWHQGHLIERDDALAAIDALKEGS